MKLIYLYIEKYKNIKNQGFNFSSQFECDYDNTSNELKIKDHDSCIENFFGDNINVTAIVGKNGSGKSTILEYTIEILDTFLNFLLKNKDMEDINNLAKSINFNLNTFFVLSKGKNIYIISKNYIEIINTTNNTEQLLTLNISRFFNFLETIKQKLFILHYDYSIGLLRPLSLKKDYGSHEPYSLANIDELYNENKSKNIRLVPKKTGSNKNENILNNPNYEKFKIIKHLVDKKYIKGSKDYFTPNQINLGKRFDDTIFNEFKNLKIIKEQIQTPLEFLEFNNYIYLIILINAYNHNNIKKDELISKIQTINTLDVLKQHIFDNKYDYLSLFGWEADDTKQKSKIKTLSNIINVQKVYNYLSILTDKLNINNLFTLKNNILEVILKSFTLDNISILEEIPENVLNIMIIDSDKNIEFNDLSNGEKSALRIRFYIENIITEERDSYLILLDEPSNDMHPEWQKQFLSYLIDICKDRDKTFQFILTSHSPFILSDIPKENIIFLDDGKNVSDEVDIDTFGANIHTLLSHGFFMKNGLMGEYAKEKINGVIRLLNGQGQLSDDEIKECEHIINIVGEPILKRQLQKMLDSKRLDYLSKDVKGEIEFLKHRIDVLSKRK